MPVLKRIVFFWVGQDISIPALLVRSIRRHLDPGIEVVQSSDRNTPQVPGASRFKTMNLTPSIMVARLEAYASLAIDEPTLYLDADMLVMRSFDLPELQPNEVGVTLRLEQDDRLIHEQTSEWRNFPEFRGKMLSEVMPYIYAFVYAGSEVLFMRQLVALRKAARRFHAWYGDQVSLKKELEGGRFTVRNFDGSIYNRTLATRMEYQELAASADAPCIVHFKGPHAKETMIEVGSTFGQA